jgi:hypothetical protein
MLTIGQPIAQFLDRQLSPREEPKAVKISRHWDSRFAVRGSRFD